MEEKEIENVFFVWVDARLNNAENSLELRLLENHFNEKIYSFLSVESAYSFILQEAQKRFIVVVSGSLTAPFWEKCASLGHILKIIIYDNTLHKKNYEEFPNQYFKICGVTDAFTELKFLMAKGKTSYKRMAAVETLTLHAGYHFVDNQSFIDFILIDFLFKLIQNSTNLKSGVEDFTEFSKTYIKENPTNSEKNVEQQNLKEILQDIQKNKFEDNVINWYSKESFFYRMINNTLRSSNPINIFKLRLPIFFLNKALVKVSKCEPTFPKTIYCGTIINKAEFELWKEFRTPIFLKHFQSTSSLESVALEFMEWKATNPEFYPVFLQIEVEEKYRHKLVDIQQFSANKQEAEFLISLNSFLQVKTIFKEQTSRKMEYYRIQCEFSDFQKLQVSQITINYMNEIEKIHEKDFSDIFYFAEFLKQNGNFTGLKELLRNYDVEKMREEDQILFYSYLAYSYIYEFDLNKAENSLMREKKLLEISNQKNSMKYAVCELNLGETFFYQNKFSNAKEQFKKALSIARSQKKVDLKFIADALQKIGEVHHITNEYKSAFEQYLLSNEIFDKYYPDCPAYADNLAKLGHICSDLREFSLSNIYFEQGLKLADKTVGTINVFTMDLTIRYGFSLIMQKKFETAIDLVTGLIEKTDSQSFFVQEKLRNETKFHMLIIRAYCFMRIGKFEKSEKELDVASLLGDSDILKLARVLKHRGFLHYFMNKHSESIVFLKKSMENFEKCDERYKKEKILVSRILEKIPRQPSFLMRFFFNDETNNNFDLASFLDSNTTSEVI